MKVDKCNILVGAWLAVIQPLKLQLKIILSAGHLDVDMTSGCFQSKQSSRIYQDHHKNAMGDDAVVAYKTLHSWLVVLLFYVHGKHLRSCRDGRLT